MTINNQLVNPSSIAIIGGSNNIKKPGGKIIYNLLQGNFQGNIYVVNPNEDNVQNLGCYQDVKQLPDVELAIICLPAHLCPPVINVLAKEKHCHAFIIISAGFSETGYKGVLIEKDILETLNQTNSCLLGPNCIGLLNTNYQGVFTEPLPKLHSKGYDFVSSSGSTAVFIMESAIPKGITFSSVFSVGNGTQIGIEEVLEYWDNTFDPETSPAIKLMYIEAIKNPVKLLEHTTSLIDKGCSIAAIKSGITQVGGRAAASHTGAMSNPDTAVEALFKKAGIIRCHSREELTNTAIILANKPLKNKRIAIITHAGGPAVMLTDILTANGFEVPETNINNVNDLKKKLFPGSSVQNPIDILATGTAKQLAAAINFCENQCFDIGGMVVIFGSPGLVQVDDAYQVIHEKMRSCNKPIYPVLPSTLTAHDEILRFIEKGNAFFTDEVLLGEALINIANTKQPRLNTEIIKVELPMSMKVVESLKTGFVPVDEINIVLHEIGIPEISSTIVKDEISLLTATSNMKYPLVLKAMGFTHKTDVGGVSLNIKSEE